MTPHHVPSRQSTFPQNTQMGSESSCCIRVRDDEVRPYIPEPDAEAETGDVSSDQVSLTFDQHVDALNNAAEEELAREMQRAETCPPTNMNATNDDAVSVPSECSTVVYRRTAQ